MAEKRNNDPPETTLHHHRVREFIVVQISPKRWVIAEHQDNGEGRVPHYKIITHPINVRGAAERMCLEIIDKPVAEYSYVLRNTLLDD